MNAKEYVWVKQTRKILLEFCKELDSHDFTCNLDSFGWPSIRNTLVHVADCYHAWLGSFMLLKTNRPLTANETLEQIGIKEIILRFEQVDKLVEEVLNEKQYRLDDMIDREIPWRDTGEILVITPRKLLMHTITHEYHHKGQIVAMARQLGYEPPNTDVLGTDD